MALFKSKEQRRIERDIQVRQGIQQIKRQVKSLEKNEAGYLEKARRAKQMGSNDQLALLRQAVKRAISSRMMLERQLLNIETAAQMKNQAETFGAFAKSMNAVSAAISEVFGSMDLAKTQMDFEKAMVQAESMEQRMSVFLDMSTESIGNLDTVDEGLTVSDDEIDRLLDAEAAHESRAMDDEIADGLKEIEKELGRGT